VVDAITGVVSTQIQIFKRNNVHGFIALNQQSQDGSGIVQVLVWGGRSVRVINFSLSSGEPTLSISSAEFNAPDWIMSGCAAASTGHRGGFLITANNALLSLEVIESCSPERETAISIYQLATSVKSILYSADVIALSPSHVLMASGTVFGEIIVWSCFLGSEGSHKTNAVGSIHHFFTGHDGSIFNVRISPQIASLNGGKSGRLLASCSDDRTVRIWDISDCEHKTAQDPSAYSTDGYDLRSTGFGPVEAGEQTVGSESCVVQAFGHVARIWAVYFRAIVNDGQTHMGLVSRGEDCTCVLWDLNWEKSSAGGTSYQLSEASSIQPHIGKHIWSLDLHRRGPETVVYTGGADGALKHFSIKENDDIDLPRSPPPVPEIPGFQRKRKQATVDRARAFAFVSPDCLLCSSTQGQMQIGHIAHTEESETAWETLCEAPDLGSFAVMTGLPQKGLALIGNSRGVIRLYNHATRSIANIADVGTRPLGLFFLQTNTSTADSQGSSSPIIFLVCYPTKEEVTLVKVSNWDSDCSISEANTIHLPPNFVVCSASFIFKGQCLMIGSKAGGLVVYQTPTHNEPCDPILLDRRVHGREFVNYIHTLSSITESDGTRSEFILTCGRDGTYCVHEMQICENKTDALSMKIVHRTSSMIGGNIEGAYVDETTGDLMLYGFRSQEFVLRNESKLTDIMAIASGGFRRDWTFSPGTKDRDAFFAWRDEASLRITRIQSNANHLLRAGAHGRELKAVDVFSSPGGSRSLIATGAEDTTVRLFAPTSSVAASPWGVFECVRVLDTHKSGIQQVSWSKDGNYLFTSAAFEEFFVWSVRTIPSFGVATNLLAASPKEDAHSDLRILSFDVLEVREVEGGQGFLLCLALSNSTIKVSASPNYKISQPRLILF
jgi:WD40 repeat protein